ncbi:MAG: DUF3000 domain-containing protein [Microbacteriaceae bacterium]
MSSSPTLPKDFEDALGSLRAVIPRTELVVTEITAPSSLAPYGIAFAVNVLPQNHEEDSDLGAGRFVLLYNPEEQEGWGGNFRIIMYSHAPLDVEIGTDPFLASVTWSWLTESLQDRGAEYLGAAGTATKILSTGFGSLAESGDGAKIELRASWTPLDSDIGPHLAAWLDVVGLLAGLPPASGTESLSMYRNRRGAN